ncbi:hypothetical protein LXL04_004347 [Taraxacum kok-saghyz]
MDQSQEQINSIDKFNLTIHHPLYPPSSKKATIGFLDECLRDVEKDLTPNKDTWYSQDVSIASDEWTNVKHKPLINVLEVNSRLTIETNAFCNISLMREKYEEGKIRLLMRWRKDLVGGLFSCKQTMYLKI